jgi:hypothetical protein
VITPFSNGRGVQISLPLPEMRQTLGFDAKIASEACRAMGTLVRWYIDKAGFESS